MRMRNIPLIIGGIILFVMLMVMLYPRLFTDNSPYPRQLLRFTHDNNQLSIERAPFQPSEQFVLGSDDLGRDIYSMIIYGTRMTIFLGISIALLQFFIAIPFALYGGFGNPLAKGVISQLNVTFSAIPALLISIILLKLDFFTSLESGKSIIAFIAVISAVSWPKLAYLLMERVEAINQQPFIRGEVAIGKTRLKIALENVLPHLAPELTVLFFMEIARGLAMMMQLGIFGVFVGNLKIPTDASSGIYINTNVSIEPEWAGMLSSARALLTTSPWAVIYPALAFFISVLGFNLFGEGLRYKLQGRTAEGISKISPVKKTFVGVGIAVIALVLLFIGGVNYTVSSDAEALKLPERSIIGTAEGQETAKIIVDQMKTLGIAPLKEAGYTLSYEIGKSYLLKEQSFEIEGLDQKFIANKDFTFSTSSEVQEAGLVYDATKVDLYSMCDSGQIDKAFENRFILIDGIHYNQSSIDYFMEEISKKIKIKGFLISAGRNEGVENLIIHASDELTVILLSEATSEVIKSMPDVRISVSSKVEFLEPIGTNVMGIYKGRDEALSDEAILVGMSYNYLTVDGKEALAANLALMEAICSLEYNKRSIIFMFLDGTFSQEVHGIYSVSEDFPYSAGDVKLYLDLTGLDSSGFNQLKYSTVLTPITRHFGWTIGQQLQRELDQQFELTELKASYRGTEYYVTEGSAYNVLFWDRGIATVILDNDNQGDEQKRYLIEDISSIILEIINKNNY